MRTPLKNRILPPYTHGEEIFNMVTHIVGGAVGVVALFSCVIAAVLRNNALGVVSGSVYGGSVILLFTCSAIYHGLTAKTAKKVFQILDHCTIFIMIAGTYTPVLLGDFRKSHPTDAWILFAFVWGVTVLGVVFNSIDLKKFSKISFVCYLLMGWCCIFRISRILDSYNSALFVYLLSGGIAYTIGAVFYTFGEKKKYIHSVWHIFTVIAAMLHLIGIVFFVV